MAEVDVVMSVYNSGRHLSTTLKSIQAQTVEDIRIIIIDDGSTDDTAAIISQAQQNDPRILYQYQTNAGIAAAVKVGMQLCTARFIARHDGDDISYPDRFQKELSYLADNPTCVAVSALARHIDEVGRPMGTFTRTKDMALVDDESLPANEPYIMQPLLMMRHDAYLAAGGYRLLTVAEDADLYWRMTGLGHLHILPEVLGDYRIHSSSISTRSIVSGRRMSAWTQLSAISAQRRRQNLPDIEFDVELQSRIDECSELIDLFEAAKPLLRVEELPWFYSSLAAKLVETCYYRPFEPSASDVQFIRSVPSLDPNVAARRFFDVYQDGIFSAAIRMCIAGRIRDALRLVQRRQWLRLAGRVFFRVIVPVGMKKFLKNIRNPQSSILECPSITR